MYYHTPEEEGAMTRKISIVLFAGLVPFLALASLGLDEGSAEAASLLQTVQAPIPNPPPSASSSPSLPTILAPSPTPGALFGYSVAAVGGNVLGGAPYDDMGASDTGAAHLLEGTTSSFLRTFQMMPQGGTGDRLGWSVAALGTNVLAGMPYYDGGTDNAGAVLLFSAFSGMLLRSFHNPSPGVGDRFGHSVAVVGG